FTECPDCITILTRRLNAPAAMMRRAVEQPTEERTGSPSPPAAVSRPLHAVLYTRITYSSQNVPTMRRAVEQPTEERTGSPSPPAAVSRPLQALLCTHFTECPDCITILTRRLNAPAAMMRRAVQQPTEERTGSPSPPAAVSRPLQALLCTHFTECPDCITILTRRLNAPAAMFTECPDCITILTRRLNAPAAMMRRAVEQPTEERTGSPSPPAAVSRPLHALLYTRITHSTQNVPTVSQY
ncbi:hypothetical protein MAR_030858, partial [Mya arenaria]